MKHIITWSRNILPASFAIVMATGIVSIAAQFWNFSTLAYALWILNGIFFLSLLVLWGTRILYFGAEVLADLDMPKKSPGFLTWVAGTNVLANQCLIVGHNEVLFRVLSAAGILLWLFIIYGFMFRAITSESKHEGEFPVSGVWLLLTVATQSTSVALANYSHLLDSYLAHLAWFLSLTLFLLGSVLYVVILSHVVLKLLFSPIKSSDMVAPNWIILGAAAISTMAGAQLAQTYIVDQNYTTLHILKTFTLVHWATATWWGPLLVALGIWKHFIKKDSFKYEPQMWSLVFPLGMYTAATYKFSHVLEQNWITHISQGVFPVALLAWIWVFTKALGAWRSIVKTSL